MHLPWYGWLGIAVVAYIAFIVYAGLAWQQKLSDDVAAYMAKHIPEWRVESRTRNAIVLRREDGEVAQFSLFNLRSAASRIPADANAESAREALFATAVATLREQVELSATDADPAMLLARIYPRIVNESFIKQLPAEAALPRRALGSTSLSVVYVVDSANSVAYVDDQRLKALGVDEPALYQRALENLSRLWPENATREAVEGGNVVVLKAMDTYDAARLLLLPDRLRANEEVAALIPDRDTCVIAPLPADGDWSRLGRLAKNRAGPELYDRVLRVSPAGIRAA
jgi:uncharacterized protein YtpQ (UPF0354 family)